MVAEPAVHGGLILLAYPSQYQHGGIATDDEVVELSARVSDGHRFVTLRLRASPEVNGRDPAVTTFVFDADDLFVVRSVHGENLGHRSEARYEYDHQGDRPIFRACTANSLAPTTPTWSARLEVTECRFGPIPESEFAPESFLGHLKSDGIVRNHVEEPSTATSLDRYWLAFVAGGISLACGSALALGSRRRDRQSLRAE